MAFAAVCPLFMHGFAAAQSPQPEMPVDAASRHRILIITSDSADPFMTRVQAEVGALPGLDVIVQGATGSLDVDARAARAGVAIRKAASGKGVEVWMADATSGRSLIRQLVVDESPDGPDQGLVALQTAELLRTALALPRNLAAASTLSPRSVPSGSGVAVGAVAPSRDNALLAGIGPLWSQGGAGSALQAWLSYQRLWLAHFGLSFDASGPLLLGSLRTSEGSARVGAISAGTGMLARLRSEHAHLIGTATLGAAIASVLVNGDPSPGNLATSTTTYTGLAYLRLAGAWKPVPWLGVGAAGLVGTSTSRIRIRFAGRGVADWGRTLLGAVLYGQIDW